MTHNNRDFSAELNADQLAAATHGDGPLLIVAGAGSGKTRTLVYRVAHLVERGVRPERILLLTFTRRAAHEMLSRAERLIGSASRNVQGGTFHATAHRLLRRFGPAAGLPRDFSIMDQGDSADLMQISRAALGLGAGAKRFPKKETLHHVYSRHVNTGVAMEDIVREEYPGSSNTFPTSRGSTQTTHFASRSAILLITTISCSSGPCCSKRVLRSQMTLPDCTIIFWWMSIRIQTHFRRVSSVAWPARTRISPLLEMMRRAFTHSAAQRSGTFWTSLSSFQGRRS